MFEMKAHPIDAVFRGYCGPRHHLYCVPLGSFRSRYSPHAYLTSIRSTNMFISALVITEYVQTQMTSCASVLTVLRLFLVTLRYLSSPSERTL